MQCGHTIRIISAIQAFIHQFKNLKGKLYNCNASTNFNIFSFLKDKISNLKYSCKYPHSPQEKIFSLIFAHCMLC